ncbi:hypothetical protein ABIA85_005903 [Bradyrhizobium sp. LA6.10]|uniref:hypothetical protein n=1 Tax=Bradyrhizobium sp. LA6.10 TaxID=3156318 RepID=UPI003390B0B3
MTYQTDERLKGYLDTNQLSQERLCRAVLALDKRFTNVTPRHPRGGPDGGRDIPADLNNEQLAYGAAGFLAQANDSAEHKKKIKSKFADDLKSAVEADTKPQAFVFFTNINLTIGEKEDLIAKGKKAGLAFCDIFDRERIRLHLDQPDGFAARFQYLNIALSEAEQASFFAKWGDEIQSMVETGFQRVERSLERILFLQESFDVLDGITLRLDLDREYSADEIGHFRAYCSMFLKEPKLKIFRIIFGSTDKSRRTSDAPDKEDEPSGIKHGIAGGQWEQHVSFDQQAPSEGTEEEEKFRPVGSSSSVGMDPVRAIFITYHHDPSLLRFEPRINFRDIDQATFLPVLNKSLAEKVETISVIANGYLLQRTKKPHFSIDSTPFELDIPLQFDEKELADPWVRVRPERSSAFSFEFSDFTPRRLFISKRLVDET